MQCRYDYFIRLSTFRNIDLPLQGVYFLQLKLQTDSKCTLVVPYSGMNGNDPGTNDTPNMLHSLFPPQITTDDSMQSTGFIVQFSDEDVSFTDVFRISVKDQVQCVTRNGKVCIVGTIASSPLVLSIDLLFSNAADVGGLDAIIETPYTAEIPSEFVVVASQNVVLQTPNVLQYFRAPLALFPEYDTAEDEKSDMESGNIYPCAFLDGVILSSCIKLELNREIYSPKYSKLVDELAMNLSVDAKDVEEAMIYLLDDAILFHNRVKHDLGLENKFGEIPTSPTSITNGIEFVARLDRLASMAFITWNKILDNFPAKIRRGDFLSQWKTFLLRGCHSFVRPSQSYRPKILSASMGQQEMLTFAINKECVPILYSDNLGPASPTSQQGHGAHLIVLVHGYQGTTNDMRLIRNTLACTCPDALILSSSANEGQTDGDIETMGFRLAMELKDFVSLHSSSLSIINRISFLGHSLGGLIVRAAIPLLSDCHSKLHVYISLSTPHLGISNKLIESGLTFLRLFKKAELLEQLTLKDTVQVKDSFLYRLSNLRSLSLFRRIILVGSSQDQYAQLSTSIISPSNDDPSAILIANNILGSIEDSGFVTVDVDFNIRDVSSIDSVIGRAAHIKFLESPVLIQLLLILNADMFDL